MQSSKPTPVRRLVLKKNGSGDAALERSASPGIDLNPQFACALDMMENGSGCIFITGKAGTGKSTLLRHFIQTTNKKVAVVAPTGAAAINVQGETIHSFFRLPPRPVDLHDIRALRDKSLYRSLDVIIIDEVSMVRADLMDGIERFLRLNGRIKSQPFGGVQVVLIGDLFQLPPIVSSDAEKQYIRLRYQSPYFFNATVFQQTHLHFLELNKVYRQQDDVFLSILNGIRSNEVAPEQIRRLNQCCQPHFKPNENASYITLTTTNARANRINAQRLAQLPAEPFGYEGEISGQFESRALPTDQLLQLKIGAQVMFLKNDANQRWVNGTIGKVHRLEPDYIEVSVTVDGRRRIYTVEPIEFEMLRYRYDEEAQRVIAEVTGTFTQYPLRLAYAVTIHKSQGLTFDNAIIDLSGGTFAHGQAYVALSRCRSLDGLVLQRPLRPRDVIVDPMIVNFARRNQMLPNATTRPDTD